jgi:hypothetical protein
MKLPGPYVPLDVRYANDPDIRRATREGPMSPWLLFTFMCLATFRLTRLVVADDFPPIARARTWLQNARPSVPKEGANYNPVTGMFSEYRWWWGGELVSCYWCCSAYIAGGIVVTWWGLYGLAAAVLWWLAVWAGGALISWLVNRVELLLDRD